MAQPSEPTQRHPCHSQSPALANRRVVLVRHGHIATADDGGLTGASDVPLSDKGREQARQLRGLAELGPSTVFHTSPLARARQTAELALDGRPYSLRQDDDLREISFGRWEGCTFADIERREPERCARWLADPLSFVFPEGESAAHLHERVAGVATRLLSVDAPCQVVFAHAGSLRILLCELLGLGFRHQMAFHFEHARPCRVDLHDGQAILRALNAAPGPDAGGLPWVC